ncbi:protein of unknown function (plasmid) [Cupriavidus taiwanensis]|uniref:Uncharacterized protein n=1 Tax=Cupriavidus taiwanensis TaxID=164546 RepID=A0A375FHI3_9BURK|nr:protein of unknown function [Cupriavidus taiwanensis]SOZ72457.1 protein of unknown function [Cupriavidus taiwanensis]SOZ74863.1 protein of unknown function [Cupriavidus taiwanensis]SPA03658.1 protein of unknown function [Cupriavidus taiwanensis]SPA11554.1 protein of unknown function [Cupriavidus taiwanensis]
MNRSLTPDQYSYRVVSDLKFEMLEGISATSISLDGLRGPCHLSGRYPWGISRGFWAH